MTKPNQLKPFEIGYSEKIIFYPRGISIQEEEEYNARFSDISDTDEERYEKTFELCKEALAEFSAEMPQRLVKENGETKRVPLVEGAETPHASIMQFFAERTVENERIIRNAYYLYKSQQVPESRFLPPSVS